MKPRAELIGGELDCRALWLAVVEQARADARHLESQRPERRQYARDAVDFLSNPARIGPVVQILGIKAETLKAKIGDCHETQTDR